MKTYQVFLLWACTAVLLGSCNDMLDLPSDGHKSLDKVFTERNSTLGLLNACYNSRVIIDMNAASYTDEAYDTRVLNAGTTYDYWYNLGHDIDNFRSFETLPWSKFYEGIRLCNKFLAGIGSYSGYSTEHEVEGWMAQVYCLRAYYYLNLFKRYGEIPLVLTADDLDFDASKVSKAKVGDIVKQILADCYKALEKPSGQGGLDWFVSDDNQMRIMTRGVAYAIMSEAVTFACSPLFDDGTFTAAEAADISGRALAECLVKGGYSLWSTTSPYAPNAYGTYFLQSPYDRRLVDRETIFAMNGQNKIWTWFGLPSTPGAAQAGICPSQELIDAYEMANGQPAITGYADDKHLEPIVNKASGYDPNNPYQGRDPRFYATVYYNGALRSLAVGATQKVETFVGGADGLDRKDRKHTSTGYYLRKYNDYRSDSRANNDGYLRIWRLADLYLYFAENAVNAGNPDKKWDLGNGVQMSALDAMNAVRSRAGMPAVAAGISQTACKERIRNERFVEFAFEGRRFFDLRRWKEVDKFRVVTGMQIVNKGNTFDYIRFKFADRVASTTKYLLYPIDKDEVAKMKAKTGIDWQNPGW